MLCVGDNLWHLPEAVEDVHAAVDPRILTHAFPTAGMKTAVETVELPWGSHRIVVHDGGGAKLLGTKQLTVNGDKDEYGVLVRKGDVWLQRYDPLSSTPLELKINDFRWLSEDKVEVEVGRDMRATVAGGCFNLLNAAFALARRSYRFRNGAKFDSDAFDATFSVDGFQTPEGNKVAASVSLGAHSLGVLSMSYQDDHHRGRVALQESGLYEYEPVAEPLTDVSHKVKIVSVVFAPKFGLFPGENDAVKTDVECSVFDDKATVVRKILQQGGGAGDTERIMVERVDTPKAAVYETVELEFENGASMPLKVDAHTTTPPDARTELYRIAGRVLEEKDVQFFDGATRLQNDDLLARHKRLQVVVTECPRDWSKDMRHAATVFANPDYADVTFEKYRKVEVPHLFEEHGLPFENAKDTEVPRAYLYTSTRTPRSVRYETGGVSRSGFVQVKDGRVSYDGREASEWSFDAGRNRILLGDGTVLLPRPEDTAWWLTLLCEITRPYGHMDFRAMPGSVDTRLRHLEQFRHSMDSVLETLGLVGDAPIVEDDMPPGGVVLAVEQNRMVVHTGARKEPLRIVALQEERDGEGNLRVFGVDGTGAAVEPFHTFRDFLDRTGLSPFPRGTVTPLSCETFAMGEETVHGVEVTAPPSQWLRLNGNRWIRCLFAGRHGIDPQAFYIVTDRHQLLACKQESDCTATVRQINAVVDRFRERAHGWYQAEVTWANVGAEVRKVHEAITDEAILKVYRSLKQGRDSALVSETLFRSKLGDDVRSKFAAALDQGGHDEFVAAYVKAVAGVQETVEDPLYNYLEPKLKAGKGAEGRLKALKARPANFSEKLRGMAAKVAVAHKPDPGLKPRTVTRTKHIHDRPEDVDVDWVIDFCLQVKTENNAYRKQLLYFAFGFALLMHHGVPERQGDVVRAEQHWLRVTMRVMRGMQYYVCALGGEIPRQAPKFFDPAVVVPEFYDTSVLKRELPGTYFVQYLMDRCYSFFELSQVRVKDGAPFVHSETYRQAADGKMVGADGTAYASFEELYNNYATEHGGAFTVNLMHLPPEHRSKNAARAVDTSQMSAQTSAQLQRVMPGVPFHAEDVRKDVLLDDAYFVHAPYQPMDGQLYVTLWACRATAWQSLRFDTVYRDAGASKALYLEAEGGVRFRNYHELSNLDVVSGLVPVYAKEDGKPQETKRARLGDFDREAYIFRANRLLSMLGETTTVAPSSRPASSQPSRTESSADAKRPDAGMSVGAKSADSGKSGSADGKSANNTGDTNSDGKSVSGSADGSRRDKGDAGSTPPASP